MHVRVNAAMSVDGKLSSRRREQIAISGPADFDRVDRIRAASDAILVGIGTVLADDPALLVEEESRISARAARGRGRQPARVVADSRGRTPTDARVLDGQSPTYILAAESIPPERVDALRSAGATVVTAGEERVDLVAGLAALEADHGVNRLMVEGGGEVIFSLFEADLVDELSVYVGSVLIGGADAPTLADGEGFVDPASLPTLSLAGVTRLDDGVLLEYDCRPEEDSAEDPHA